MAANRSCPIATHSSSTSQPERDAMESRLTGFEDDFDWDNEEAGEPQAIGMILAELLAFYQARFTAFEVPAAA